MNFEMTDMEQLAMQTAKAFDLKNAHLTERWPCCIQGYLEPIAGVCYVLDANFEESIVSFAVKIYEPDFKCASVVFWPDGTIEGTERQFSDWDEKCLEILLKGLFHLSLFTQDVEDALEVTITAHQKLEWLWEYETRLKSEMNRATFDWETEAKRITCAFGLTGECEFECQVGRYALKHKDKFARLSDGSSLDCIYYGDGYSNREFTIRSFPLGNSLASVWFYPDGVVSIFIEPKRGTQFSLPIARALFKLGLLTKEIESGLGVSILSG